MPTTEPEKVVRITMRDGIPVPEQDPIVLKQGNQRLKWSADFEFRITIEDYADLQYSDGGARRFHCKTGLFNQPRTHKYTISANGVDNDPVLDIQP
jgi:hypothetical protein